MKKSHNVNLATLGVNSVTCHAYCRITSGMEKTASLFNFLYNPLSSMTLKTHALMLFAVCLALAVLPLYTIAQDVSIQIIDRIPVEMETGSYRKAPDSNNHISILSADCKFWTLGIGSHLASTVFDFNKPMPLASRQGIAYRIVQASDSGLWQPISKNRNTLNKRVFLGQVTIAPGQQCELQFKVIGSGNILQHQVIQRSLIVPVYMGFRQHEGNRHSEEESLISKSLLEASIHPAIAGLPAGNVLLLQPGLATDILLKNQGLNVDSSLEYNFGPLEKSNRSNWLTTGAVLHLEPLPGASNYVLQVRYRGMPAVLNFFVASKPYWYQRTLFKILFMLLAVAILLGVPWYIYRYRSQREKWLRGRLEGQLQLVHNQLNPHFIFNSLSSITSLIGSGANDRAIAYLSVFSGMMRHTMSVSDKTVISLSEDLDQMEQYLRIEQLRFQFRYRIDVSNDLDLNAIELPPQLLQPCLENAVKHGASGLEAAGEVWLRIFANNDDLHIRILNNSKAGFRRPDKGQGQGLKFTNEQMGYLQQLYTESDIRFHLEVTNEGAEAFFFFENWLKPEL